MVDNISNKLSNQQISNMNNALSVSKDDDKAKAVAREARPVAKAPVKNENNEGVELSISGNKGSVVKESADGKVVAKAKPNKNTSNLTKESVEIASLKKKADTAKRDAQAIDVKIKSSVQSKKLDNQNRISELNQSKMMDRLDSPNNISNITREGRKEDALSDEAEKKAARSEQLKADNEVAAAKSAERRAQLLEDFTTKSEEAKQEARNKAVEQMKSESSDEAKSNDRPIVSFSGYSDAQIEQLYHQGKISYKSYQSEIDSRKESLESRQESLDRGSRMMVGLEAIMQNITGALPDSIAAVS